MQRLVRQVAWMMASAILFSCGDIETTPSEQDQSTDSPEASEQNQLHRNTPNGFVEEKYGIAANWYNYESETHVLTPEKRVYRLEKTSGTWLFEIKSYYNERGDSGYFRIKTKKVSGELFGELKKLNLSQNVKEAPVCISLSPLKERDCQSDNWDLIFKTDFRIVPAAGFAPSNPAVYFAGHWSDDKTAELSAVSSDKIQNVTTDELSETTQLGSAQHQLSTSLLGEFDSERIPSDVFIQADPEGKLIQWQITELDENTVEFKSRCIKLANSPRNQKPLSDSDSTVSEVVLEGSSQNYRLQLLDLCTGNSVLETIRTSPFEGLWPSTKRFDTMIESTDNALYLRLPPGHLFWNGTENTTDKPKSFGKIEIPESLWEGQAQR